MDKLTENEIKKWCDFYYDFGFDHGVCADHPRCEVFYKEFQEIYDIGFSDGKESVR